MLLGEIREELDKIDKVLLILPLLPLADLSSTLFGLSFGGEEVGVLARPVLENYGAYGLVMLAASASVMFLFFMHVVIHIKNLFVKELRLRWMWHVLAIPIYWIFLLEAVYASTVVLNFLVPLALPPIETTILRVLLVCTYFAGVSALTKPQIKKLPHF